MDPLEGLLGFMGVNDELDRLRAENERLHAKVSDLTARLRKCANMHRRSTLAAYGDNAGREYSTLDDNGAGQRKRGDLGPDVPITRGRKVPIRT